VCAVAGAPDSKPRSAAGGQDGVRLEIIRSPCLLQLYKLDFPLYKRCELAAGRLWLEWLGSSLCFHSVTHNVSFSCVAVL